MTFEKKLERYNELLKKCGDMKAVCVRENRLPDVQERSTAREFIREMESLEPDIEGGIALQKGQEQHDYWVSGTAITKPNPGRPYSNSAPKLFRSLGEQLTAIREAGLPGGRIDNRLHEINTRAATGMGESIASDGGFLVQSDYASEIFAPVWDANPILNKVTKFTISGNANNLKINALDEAARTSGSGNRHGGVLSYFLDEASQKIASKPKFRQMELNLKKLVVLCYATDEVLQDSSVLAQFISTTARNEIQFMLLDSIINGTGAGQPLGLMSAGCLVTQDKEPGQVAATVLSENIFKMWSRLHETNPDSTVWLVNRNVLPQLFQMNIGIGTAGSAVYLPANISGSPFSTLFGRPVIITEQCQTLGTAGDIILANMSQYCMIEKGGIQADVSIHVQFVYDESVFRFVFRVDGQPLWNAAVTPFKGSSTVSPFICLQTRS